MLTQYKFFIYAIFSSVALVLVYYPGLAGGFIFDDSSNILTPLEIRINNLSWESIKKAAFSMENRPISRASFGLNYLVSGFDPYYFKLVNITIHGINSLLVFSFVLLLLKSKFNTNNTNENTSKIIIISAAVSLGWALHPVNVTNVLYIVQRMNSLSALFVLAGMISYIKGRLALEKAPLTGWILIAISVFIFLPLAWFSKENGILLLIFLFILELTIFGFRINTNRQRQALYLFHILFVFIPVLLAIIYILQHTERFQAAYDIRNFNMMERLLTEPRILWLYIKMILLPAPSDFGIFHDDIPISISFTDPASTLPAIFGLIILFIISLASIRNAPVLSFGLLFFFAGHLMESSFIPLELAFEHRNYLPSIGLLLPLFYYLGYSIAPGMYEKARISLVVVIIVFFSLLTHLRAWTWSDNTRLYLTEVQYHPNSSRANYEAGKIFGQRLEKNQGDMQLNYSEAKKYFERVTALRENTTSGLFGIILASIDSNHEIKAVWINDLELRLASQPLEQVNLHWLDRLTDCISLKECRKEDIQIPRLAFAAIGNEHTINANKAMLFSILGKYEYQVENNKDSTLEMAHKAVSLMPANLYYRLNLARYLIWAREWGSAKNVLYAAKKLDVNNHHKAEISNLLKILESGK